MKLVEQHVIKRTDPRYQRLDTAAFASKNLWNAANYLVRQSFIFQGIYLNNTAIFHLMKEHEAYQALPAGLAQTSRGPHQSFASAWGNPSRLFDGALPDLRQP